MYWSLYIIALHIIKMKSYRIMIQMMHMHSYPKSASLYLCNCISCWIFANQHVGQLLKHIVLQWEEGFVVNSESGHEHNHLSVEMQTTYNKTIPVYPDKHHWTMKMDETNYVQGGPKNGPFLRVNNFARVSVRKACYTPKVCKFCLEGSVKVSCQCIKYSLLNLHKYSLSLKLWWIWH